MTDRQPVLQPFAMTKRVLIVDDCVNAADQLRAIVDGLPGFEVVGHAQNGAEGLKLFARLRPDVVCMDIVMPMMDGLQTARAILQHQPRVSVYMISSIADVPAKLSQAIELGARDVISKPFNREEIHAMLLA
ncbi:MAG: response regulator [Myxococcales bacterium]|nr:response regulator [Myxococcales bacterium]MDD9968429.1 response regulator [Myxococcales bacterium]